MGLAGPPERYLIAAIAGLSLDTFLSAPSFVTLHLVTSSHALRIVDRHVRLQNEWLEGYWIAWLAAYVTLGAPELLGEQSAQCSRDWADVLDDAVAADDDHINKFVYSCYAESIAYGEPRYLDAADKYLSSKTG